MECVQKHEICKDPNGSGGRAPTGGAALTGNQNIPVVFEMYNSTAVYREIVDGIELPLVKLMWESAPRLSPDKWAVIEDLFMKFHDAVGDIINCRGDL
jgi:hypothetical protein